VILLAESSAHSGKSLVMQYVLKSPVMVTNVPGIPLKGIMLFILGVYRSDTYEKYMLKIETYK
jgi:hypothetical protein